MLMLFALDKFVFMRLALRIIAQMMRAIPCDV